MKRSEINSAIKLALDKLEENKFFLPPFGYWSAAEWKKGDCGRERIKSNSLGWDITDFGSNDFEKIGAVLFTIRNGQVNDPKNGTPYAEKIIVMKPGQCIPLHFHWVKTEDIINRGGGTLDIQLYNRLPNEEVDRESKVHVFCDGVERVVEPGSVMVLNPGESITLTSGLYHKFWAGEKGGVLICGEVSSVNDDSKDNRFAEPVSRFAEIVEDEAPLRLLSNEYPK